MFYAEIKHAHTHDDGDDDLPTDPTGLFTFLENPNQEIDILFGVQERCTADFKATKL